MKIKKNQSHNHRNHHLDNSQIQQKQLSSSQHNQQVTQQQCIQSSSNSCSIFKQQNTMNYNNVENMDEIDNKCVSDEFQQQYQQFEKQYQYEREQQQYGQQQQYQQQDRKLWQILQHPLDPQIDHKQFIKWMQRQQRSYQNNRNINNTITYNTNNSNNNTQYLYKQIQYKLTIILLLYQIMYIPIQYLIGFNIINIINLNIDIDLSMGIINICKNIIMGSLINIQKFVQKITQQNNINNSENVVMSTIIRQTIIYITSIIGYLWDFWVGILWAVYQIIVDSVIFVLFPVAPISAILFACLVRLLTVGVFLTILYMSLSMKVIEEQKHQHIDRNKQYSILKYVKSSSILMFIINLLIITLLILISSNIIPYLLLPIPILKILSCAIYLLSTDTNTDTKSNTNNNINNNNNNNNSNNNNNNNNNNNHHYVLIIWIICQYLQCGLIRSLVVAIVICYCTTTTNNNTNTNNTVNNKDNRLYLIVGLHSLFLVLVRQWKILFVMIAAIVIVQIIKNIDIQFNNFKNITILPSLQTQSRNMQQKSQFNPTNTAYSNNILQNNHFTSLWDIKLPIQQYH